MAEKGAEGSVKPKLTAAEKELQRRRMEFINSKTNAARLRRWNLFTALAVGAFAVGMFSFAILSVKQEKVMDELDDEVKMRFPRTGANS